MLAAYEQVTSAEVVETGQEAVYFTGTRQVNEEWSYRPTIF
jgi:hypothetical protein